MPDSRSLQHPGNAASPRAAPVQGLNFSYCDIYRYTTHLGPRTAFGDEADRESHSLFTEPNFPLQR